MKQFIYIGTIALITVLLFNGCKEDDPYWDPNKYVEIVMDSNNNAYDFNLGFVNATTVGSNFDGIFNEPWCTDLPALCGSFEITDASSFASLSSAPIGEYSNDCLEVPLNTVLVYKLNDGSYALVKIVDDVFTSTDQSCQHRVTLHINYPAFSGSSNNNNNNEPVTGTFTDSRDNHVYKTVTIGDQIWMAENLAYLPFVVPSGSDYASYLAPRIYVYGYEGTDVNVATSNQNYKTYGALYNWPAALEACPAGWELPTYDDWEELSTYLGGNTVSGGKLKETGFDHWLNPNTNASDEFGFTALPGGFRSHGSGGAYLTLNETGYWWSASSNGDERAWRRDISYNMYDLALHDYHKEHGYSVRCIKSDERYGYMTDNRDGRTYKTIQIGEQNWMAENLAWLPELYPPQTLYRSYTEPRYYVYGYYGGDVADDFATFNYNTYGALYNWPAAMTACPAGWRLPSYNDWEELSNYLGGQLVSGGKLKETGFEHWKAPNTNAKDEVLFSALPGGCRHRIYEFGSSEGGYDIINLVGYWWSSTESNTDMAWRRDISYNMYDLALHDYYKEFGYSVRCIEGESSGGNTGGEVSFGSFTDSRDGYTYKTVKIGDQVWMAENLRATKYRNNQSIGTTSPATLNIRDANAPTYEWAYDGDASYATEHGRLYTWHTATDSRGLCPAGWHLPSDNEWRTLEQYLAQNGFNCDGEPATSLADSYNLVAKAMSLPDVWKSSTNIYTPGNSSDTQTESYRNKSGFSAMPGGERSQDGPFSSIESFAGWWTSTSDDASYDAALYRSIISDGSNLIRGPRVKNTAMSVRCLLGEEEGGNNNGSVITGTMTDPRDGTVYKTVQIGNQTWMAENLKATKYRNNQAIGTTTPATLNITNESAPTYEWVYDGYDSYETVYGRLYTWYTATDPRGLCPIGWHLPSYEEWNELIYYIGDEAGGKLKETGTTHWSITNTAATNEYGFTALPGGYRWGDGYFAGIGDSGYWWSNTESDTDHAWTKSMNHGLSAVSEYRNWKRFGCSVRCVKDSN